MVVKAKPRPHKRRRSKPLPVDRYDHDLERDEHDELDCLKCGKHWVRGPRVACTEKYQWEY